MKKKLISMVLSVFMIVSLFCGTYFAAKNILGFEPATSQVAVQDKDENVSAKATPSGTWADATEDLEFTIKGTLSYHIECHIYSEGQLAQLCKKANAGAGETKKVGFLTFTPRYKNATIYLETDLDMSAHYWTPIGTKDNPFGGNFYGQGHTIDGVYIKTQVADDGVERAFGLFGFVDGYIKDVAVRGDYEFLPEENDCPVDDVAIGGIAGCLRANSGGHSTHSIEDCTFDGKITISSYSDNGSYVGGIVGVVYQSEFKESPNGGDGHSTSILCCTNYARIEFSDASCFSIGGIVARINCDTTYVQACTNLGLFCKKDCSNEPIITVDDVLWEIKCFGGIVGAAYGTNVYGCVNYSTICVAMNANSYAPSYAPSYAHNLGGIVGVGYDYVYIEKCVNYGDIGTSSHKDDDSKRCVGGIAGQLGANKSELVYGWKDTKNAKTHVHCHNCISYGHVYGKITTKPSHWVSALVGWINAGTNLNAMDGCRYLSYAVNRDSDTTSAHWCEYSDDMKNGKKVVGPRHDYCDTFSPTYYSSSGSRYFDMEQNGGNWTYCSFDSYGLQSDNVAAAQLNTMSGYEMTWTTAAKNYLKEFFTGTLNGATIVNIDYCPETIVPSAALRRFKLELKWADSSGTRRNFSSDSFAKIKLKNESESTSCTYAYVYHLKGAVYNNVGKWSSDALFSITYDSNQFTFSTFEESVATKRINWKSTYGVKFDFKVGSVGMAISDYKTFSYFGADNYQNPPTITAVFTAKTQNVTFETYLGSTKTAGLGVIKTGTTYGSGDTIVGSSSSSGVGVYSYLATISANITPTLGYYLYAVKDEKDNAKTLDREYVTSYGGRTRLTIENYNYNSSSSFTTLKFVFKRIEYAYRLLCSWDSNSELSRVDKRWCIGNALTGADNTPYSANSIPTKLQYGWTYYISAVVFGNGDDGPTDTHNLTYNANNQGCIYTSGTSRRIGFDGVLSSFTFDENAFYLACGNIDFVLKRTAIDYEIQTQRIIQGEGDSAINDDRGGKFLIKYDTDANPRDPVEGTYEISVTEVNAGKTLNVGFETYHGYNLVEINVNGIQLTTTAPYTGDFKNYLVVLATNGALQNENDFSKTITIQAVLAYKEMTINTSEMKSVQVAGVNKDLTTNKVPYFNEINVTARDSKSNEKFLGIYSGENLLTTESTYTFLVDANVSEIGELSIEAKFVKFETASAGAEEPDLEGDNRTGYKYLITKPEHLIWVSEQVNKDGRENIGIKLENDIDMSGIVFRALGVNIDFVGEVEGYWKKIINLTAIDGDGNLTDGLFVPNKYVPNKIKHLSYEYNDSYIINNNVVTISSAQDLIWFSEMVNAGFDFSGYIVRQTQDINMFDEVADKFLILNPIGSTAHPFCGVYDGQNHIISNLNYSGWETISYVGFFGKTQNAVVKNLTIKDSIFTGYNDVGVFAAVADSTTFENVNAYNCTLNALHLQFYDIYGNEISKCGNDDTISVNYIRSTTIETQGKTATSRLAQSFRQMTLFGGFVGNGTKCNFVLASYINGTHTNELGREIYAFVGSGSNNTFDRCCALTQFSRSSQEISVPRGSVVYARNGGTRTDILVAQKNGSSITTLIKSDGESKNSENWITINGLEVLKDFYWYFN